MIITKTPLRISFFGGGSDFPAHYNQHGGAVLSTAIDKYIYVCISQRFDGKTAVNYGPNHEVVWNTRQIKHEIIDACNNYMYYKHGVNTHGTETTTIANVTGRGSGLGSSSALTVGYLNALRYLGRGNGWAAIPNGRKWLAETANIVEIDQLSRPQGIQDAYPAAYGGLKLYEFDDRGARVNDNRVSVRNINNLFSHLIMISIGQREEPSHEILKEQHTKTAENVEILQNLSARALMGWRDLKHGDIKTFGLGLHLAWQEKKKMASNITNTTIDKMYEMAIKNGAWGGKVCGAGGGGYLLLCAPPEKHSDIISAIKLPAMPIKYEPTGSKVIYGDQ